MEHERVMGARPTSRTQRSPHWLEGLAGAVRRTYGGAAAAPRTALSCDVDERTRTLYLPPEMRTLQPHALRWLEGFAGRSGFRVAVGQRHDRVDPLAGRRDGDEPLIARGIAGLMHQTGLPGPLARLSLPHRLLADSPLIDLPALLAMGAHALPDAKQVVLLPNAPLQEVLCDDTRPVRGFACRLETRTGPTLLSHFDGPSLRCIGYSAGRQYVVHVLLAGGTLGAPVLWTRPETLARTEPRFRLFRGRCPEHDVGLIYTTLYYDMLHHRPLPWWIGAEQLTGTQPTLARAG